MPEQYEDRRHNVRRVDDLEKLYSELKNHIEVVKLDTRSTKSLIQSTANMLQSNQKLLENKMDHLREIVTSDIERIDMRCKGSEDQIEELTGLSNKVKGSLLALNWIGIGTFGMAALAFIKIFFIGGKP